MAGGLRRRPPLGPDPGPKLVTAAIQQCRPDVCQRLALVVQVMPSAVQTAERVLDDVLGGHPVTQHDDRQPEELHLRDATSAAQLLRAATERSCLVLETRQPSRSAIRPTWHEASIRPDRPAVRCPPGTGRMREHCGAWDYCGHSRSRGLPGCRE